MHSDLLPKGTEWKGRGKEYYTVRKPEKKLLQPGDQGQYQQWSHVESMHLNDEMRMVLYLCGLPSQNL